MKFARLHTLIPDGMLQAACQTQRTTAQLVFAKLRNIHWQLQEQLKHQM